jgi:hypothetical protein
MANRSDFNSVLPRQIKKMLALTPYASKGEARRDRLDWIAAHAHHKQVNNRRRSQGGSNNSDTEE